MTFQYTQAMVDKAIAQNVTVKYNNKKVTTPKVFYTTDTVAIDCGVGLEFNQTPRFVSYDSWDGDMYLDFTITHSNTKSVVKYALNAVRRDYDDLDFSTKSIGGGGGGEVTQFTIPESFNQILIDNGSVLTVNDATVVLPYNVIEGDILKVVCESGREFYIENTPPSDPIFSVYVKYFDSFSYSEYFLPFNEVSKTEANLTIPDLNVLWSVADSSRHTDIHLSTVQKTPEVSGNNNAYLITPEILRDVTANRFKIVTSSEGGSSVSDQIFDYGNYILSVLELPFSVNPDYIGLNDNVVLADLDTGVSAPKIINDVLELDLGTISIPNPTDNSLGILNTITVLNLPYIPPTVLDTESVIGFDIKVKYLVDLYTGNTFVNVISSKHPNPILNLNVDLGFNIPIANSLHGDSLDNGPIDKGGDNGVRIASIDVIRKDSPLSGDLFTIPVKDSGAIVSSGYYEFINTKMNFNIKGSDSDLLITALNSGVFINE